MAADIAGHLAAAGRMADMDRILEIELLDELGEIVGIGVEIIALPGLARAAVAATVMRDAAVAARGKEEHLVFQRVRGKRPAMAEDHRLPFAPVLKINFGSVFRLDEWHGWFLSLS